MKSLSPAGSLLGAVVCLASVVARPLLAQDCPFDANDYTNEAATQIQYARGMADDAGRAPYYQSALESLELAIAADPNDLAALWLFGEAYVGLGDYEAADSMLDRLVELAPGCRSRAEQTRRTGWVTAYNEGIQAFNAGDTSRALEAFETANLIYQDARSFNNVAYIYQQRGELEKAIDAYRTARQVAEEPEPLRAATINLAELLTSNQRAAEAIEIYAEYTESHPDEVLARINYAVLLAQAGERELSREILTELMSREENTFEEWNELGVGLLRVYAVDEAIPIFRRARQLEPYNKDVMANTVDAFVEAGLFGDALPLADTLVKWYPYDAAQYGPLAACFSRTERAGDALMYLQLRESLPFEFQGAHLTRGGGGQYVVRGQLVGRGGSVGATITIPFEFLGRDGEVIASEDLSLLIPPAGVARSFRLQIVSDTPVAGFRYSRGGS